MSVIRCQQEENRTIWLRRIKLSREYPGSVKDFCSSEGITYAMLKYWRGKLECAANKRPAAEPVKASRLPSPFVRAAASVPEQQQSMRQEAVQLIPKSGARFVAEVLWHMYTTCQGLAGK